MTGRARPSAPAPRSAEQTPPALPRNYLGLCILLLLRKQPSHGYELLTRLPDVGFSSTQRNGRYTDSGALYRVLRSFESDGLVRSTDAGSTGAGRRRIYELTPAGVDELERRAHAVARTRDLIDGFVSRYESAVAAGPDSPSRRLPSLVAKRMLRRPLEELNLRRSHRDRQSDRRHALR